jgi:cytochrome c peroxidase
MPITRKNTVTTSMLIEGHRLFFEPNLSRDRTLSCVSCHDVDGSGGVDQRA